MTLFILAVAGSALLLTQSVIFAPLREWFAQEAAHRLATSLRISINIERGSERLNLVAHRALISLAKLVSCPMCAGFWLGLAWGTGLFWPISFPVAFLAYGPAGSLVSAIGVAVWLLLVEIRDASAMWRYLNQPKE